MFILFIKMFLKIESASDLLNQSTMFCPFYLFSHFSLEKKNEIL